jgi:hypothetical protein
MVAQVWTPSCCERKIGDDLAVQGKKLMSSHLNQWLGEVANAHPSYGGKHLQEHHHPAQPRHTVIPISQNNQNKNCQWNFIQDGNCD